MNRSARRARPLTRPGRIDLGDGPDELRARGQHRRAVHVDGLLQPRPHRRFDGRRLRRQRVSSSSGSAVPAGTVTSRPVGCGARSAPAVPVRRQRGRDVPAAAGAAAAAAPGRPGRAGGCARPSRRRRGRLAPARFPAGWPWQPASGDGGNSAAQNGRVRTVVVMSCVRALWPRRTIIKDSGHEPSTARPMSSRFFRPIVRCRRFTIGPAVISTGRDRDYQVTLMVWEGLSI